MLLLDSGVWIAAKNEEDRFSPDARRLVTETDRPMAALALTLYEVANVIGSRQRESGVALALCRTIAARCGDRVLTADLRQMETCVRIAAECGLTAYDAAYVAAARSHGWTLVSTDIADLVSKGLAVTPDAALYP
ncbi:MAG TPA: PIN domain-containing protein [Solirubrobacterales bacterium]|nr:PIN domain-containing protein [Solirubrobacterales bacterium]